ncbi:hypothetical protein EMIT0196P_130142 [Pseudomonas chlororaphis]
MRAMPFARWPGRDARRLAALRHRPGQAAEHLGTPAVAAPAAGVVNKGAFHYTQANPPARLLKEPKPVSFIGITGIGHGVFAGLLYSFSQRRAPAQRAS